MAARAGLRAALAALVVVGATGDTPPSLVSGDQVFFTVPATDHRITVEDNGYVQAYWTHHGVWQHFTVERKDGSGQLLDGDKVYLKAWSGKYVQTDGSHFHAVSDQTNEEEEFKIRLAERDDDDDDEGGGRSGKGGRRTGGLRSGKGGRRMSADDGGAILPGSRVVLETSSRQAVIVNDPAAPGVVSVGSVDADLASRVLVVEMAPLVTTTPVTTLPPTTAEATTTTLPPTTTTLPPTTTTLPPTTTTLPPTTTTLPPTTTTLPPTTTTLPPTTTTLPPTTTTLPPTTTTLPPTTTTLPPTTTTLPPTTTTLPPTTTTLPPTTTTLPPTTTTLPPTTTTLPPTTTTLPPTTTTLPPATTTLPPTTTTLPPTTTTLPPTTTTLPPTTTTLPPTTTTLPPTTTTLPPTTTTLPPTTTTPPATTTTLPPTTTAGAGAPRCAAMSSGDIPKWLSVKTLRLPGKMRECTGSFSIQMSCRHAYYAASPVSEYHAMVYNDYTGKAWVVMFDGEDNIVKTKAIGSEKVRGLQFEPKARHLVALISLGTNKHPTNSSFVKMKVPSLETVWSKEIGSQFVGMEKWTPDNSDHIAISEDRYVLHSSGDCYIGWCSGHQGDIYRVLNATTGVQMDNEQKDWVASHSCKQMVAYNEVADSFLVANFGDAYPEALQFTAWDNGKHLGEKLKIDGWATPGGRQGFTQGAIKADPWGTGYAAVWSHGERYDDPDKMFFAMINVTSDPRGISFLTPPRKVFPDSGSRTQIGSNVAALGGGRWLVAYTDSATNRINDHLRIWFEDWSIPETTRKQGTKLAILDSKGEVLGEPMAAYDLGGAFFPIEVNHLMRRPSGIGWVGLEGPNSDEVKVMQVRCTPDAAA